MMRKLFGMLGVAVLLCASAVLADEFKGVIKKVDADAKKITVTVDGKEKTLSVSDDAKLPGRKDKPGTLEGLAKQVERAGDKGVNATIVTDKNDKVTEIRRQARNKSATPPQ